MNNSDIDLGPPISSGMEVTQLHKIDGKWMITPFWLTVLSETTESEFTQWRTFSMKTCFGSEGNYCVHNDVEEWLRLSKWAWSANPDHVRRAKTLVETAHEECEPV